MALVLAAPDDELGAEPLEDRRVRRRVGLVALLVVHLDAPDPITFGHVSLPLASVESLDDDEIRLRLAVAQFLGRLVFGRTIAGERRLVAWKFEHHGAGAQTAFRRLGASAADQEPRAVFAERRRVGGLIGLVG